MRTTLMIPDSLYRDVKLEAVRRNTTVTSLVEQALRDLLSPSEASAPRPFRLEPFQGQGLQAGVDLSDSAALLDLLDQP
ncbi:MAG: hypothetical protein LBG60_02505 [Bifidobacteriaceae bacterium]|jgi:hypothetical protein|nr:hypothetical protein [Bifidobacteriaceae bacterium]